MGTEGKRYSPNGVQLPPVSGTLLGAISHSAGTPFYRLSPEISGRDHPALCTNARLERSVLKTDHRVTLQAKAGKKSSSVAVASKLWRGRTRNVAGSEMSWFGEPLSQHGETETAR